MHRLIFAWNAHQLGRRNHDYAGKDRLSATAAGLFFFCKQDGDAKLRQRRACTSRSPQGFNSARALFDSSTWTSGTHPRTIPIKQTCKELETGAINGFSH
jgi:hypothetical protein